MASTHARFAEGVGYSRRRLLGIVGGAVTAGAIGALLPGIAAADSATGTFSGSVAPHGAYARYRIDNPHGTPVTITMAYGPYNAGSAHGVGFAVWQKGKKIYHGSGQATGLHDHVNSSTVSTTLTPAAGTPLTIKVFNFTADPVSYTLTIAGDSVAAVNAAKSTAGPTSLAGTVSGSFDGSDHQQVNEYTVASPTAVSHTFTMAYTPYDASQAHRIGFAIWQNGKRILKETGQATGFKDHANSAQPTGKVTPVAGQPLLIKVFNFTGTPISYTLTMS